MDYPEPPEGGTVLSPYHVCDLTALICLATIVADSSFPALQRLARLGLIQVSVAAAVRHNHNSEEKAFDEERRRKRRCHATEINQTKRRKKGSDCWKSTVGTNTGSNYL